ncbi:AH receptor-interacting protein-like isoform X2 [Dreissena polymorpha]|nr:AH receptor-interacting protein-like isoform X2 [Dreissena polymorpha]
MEMILGKKFKLEVWEELIKTMRVKEIAEFIVDQKHVDQYALVSKQLRGIFSKNPKKHAENGHCCGMMAMSEHGLGYADLDELVKNPQPLTFTMEVLSVHKPDSFEKEVWTLNDDEKIKRLDTLQADGKVLVKDRKYHEAADKYSEAVGILEQLEMKEKPGDPEWHELEDRKIVFLSNFSECKLQIGDFYPVIEHTSTVLKRQPDNVKALFRRAKAHMGAWNPEEAKSDFERVMELDPSLTKTVKKLLHDIEELQKAKDEEDKKKLQGMFAK